MFASLVKGLCLKDKKIKRRFKGIYAEDQFYATFQNLPAKDIACIVNTGTRKGGGEHWYCIHYLGARPNSPIELFDSFGYRPREYGGGAFEKWLKTNGKEIVANKKTVQDLASPTCGLFTVYVLYFLCRGLPLPKIMSQKFSSNTFLNEQLVRNFAIKNFNLNINAAIKGDDPKLKIVKDLILFQKKKYI